MRLLSIDGWDVPCARPRVVSHQVREKSSQTPMSSLQTCMRKLDGFADQAPAVHLLEVANPACVVTAKNR